LIFQYWKKLANQTARFYGFRSWSSVAELAVEMEKFVEYFNENYLHSALSYKTPNAFENEWFKNNQITLSKSA
jgi:transposase InsO family protein